MTGEEPKRSYKRFYNRYRDELLKSVIPFWEDHCIDTEYGGYFTFLDRDGSVYDTEKYMWMQWRIVYMFAELYLAEFSKNKWLDIAINGYDFLTKYGKDREGFYYFALNRKGIPSVAPYNIYSNCFAAMGAAALYRATGEKRYREEAISALNKYFERLDNPKGRWTKVLSGKKSYKEFGHYMMFINMVLLMKNYIGVDRFDSEVKEFINLILHSFWNPEHGVIFENITKDLEIDLETCTGRHINPGHGLEAMWFILRYAEKANREDIIGKVTPMIKSILEFGWDKKYGGFFYFLDVLGKPKIELEWDMKLWWVHNEAIITSLYAYYLTGESVFWEWFERIDAWTWNHFPDKEYGEWFGYLNRQGEVTNYLKGGKWKTFFHLPRFLLISMDLLKKLG